jgi:hypothetical protein
MLTTWTFTELNLGFPVNSIAVLRDLVVVAGGGGEAKTGIPNALVLHYRTALLVTLL